MTLETIKSIRGIIPVQTGGLSLEAIEGKKFTKEFPPKTWVWEDDSKLQFGRCIENKDSVYSDPKKPNVWVIDVGKREGMMENWSISSVLMMSQEDKEWRGIIDIN